MKALQRLLTRLGARPGPVDGLYGPLTQAGVARFQHKAGVAVDGIAGTQTTRRWWRPPAALALTTRGLPRPPGSHSSRRAGAGGA